MNEIDYFLNDEIEPVKVEPEIIIDQEIKNRLWKLNDTEYENLKQSLINEGCRDALMLWNNILIDGHNRYEICKAFDIEYKTIQKHFNNKNEVLKWIDTNQLSRRNLTDEQRTILYGRISKINKLEKGGTGANQFNKEQMRQNVLSANQQKAADELKISTKTLQRAEKYVDAIDDIEKNVGKEIVDKIVTGDIKITKEDTVKISKMEPDEQKKIINRIIESPKLKVSDAKKIEIKSNLINEGKKAVITNNLIDIRFGEFMKVLNDVPDNSIDIILTDPPYPYEFINCWTDLGIFAQNKLKDGGFLIAYSGHIHLPEVINRVLDSGLKWYWLGSCLHTGHGLSQVFEANVLAKHKPILFFYKGEKHKQKNWMVDVFESKDEETKEFHKWGQTVDVFDKIIKLFEPSIVIDPFLGGGTTAIACLMNQVQFIGAEIDEDAFNISKKRISDYDTE